ncbi:hypothetical protein [Parasediminibacterium sp. JCM 36343]|uniref:hypothetical protein n=1 Tax=Parasediminibacterium sp. JCM 36343 TaxID=3374279 RepID=UPI00397AC77A
MFKLEKNLPKIGWTKTTNTKEDLDTIKSFTTLVEKFPYFTDSPDIKDNFLFDLVIQTNSEIIVTKEKALLEFIESPVAIHDIKWFKETYPVPLLDMKLNQKTSSKINLVSLHLKNQ